MALHVFEKDSAEWVLGRDSVPPELQGDMTELELEGAVRVHHPGSDDQLQMFEVRVPPNVEVAAHAHKEDEIILVAEGELRFGAHLLEAGASIFIPGMTLYAFRTGPEGVHFFNFRATRDMTYIPKSEFLAAKRGEG